MVESFSLDDMLRLAAEKNAVEVKLWRLEGFLKTHLCEAVFCPSCHVDVPAGQKHTEHCVLFTPEGVFK